MACIRVSVRRIVGNVETNTSIEFENAEGLIGVTFKVEGPIDAPRVFVNPLSAVAPGILRKIFEYR